MKKIVFIFCLLLVGISLQAQQQPLQKPNRELVQFFAGKWHGKGKFSNGKPITADLSFEASLDSMWVSHQHMDRTPNTYKAASWWGTDQQTGKFVAYAFDNYGGHRKFESEGWKNGRLVLTTQQKASNGTPTWQHFIYEKLTDHSFKMTFEVSRDGTTWRMVDYLVFERS